MDIHLLGWGVRDVMEKWLCRASFVLLMPVNGGRRDIYEQNGKSVHSMRSTFTDCAAPVQKFSLHNAS